MGCILAELWTGGVPALLNTPRAPGCSLGALAAPCGAPASPAPRCPPTPASYGSPSKDTAGFHLTPPLCFPPGVLFSTHDEVEHLALMERSLGSLPPGLLRRASGRKIEKNFRHGTLRWHGSQLEAALAWDHRSAPSAQRPL